MKKYKILIAGRCDFGPIGRHFQSFMNYLLKETDYDIYIDNFYISMYRNERLGTSELGKEFKMSNRVHSADKTLCYDFAIFTDLLTIGYDKIYEEFLSYQSHIRICYEVFDGSIPPLDWIYVINNDFDICLSPSVYISTALKNNGITIPCFNLPCAVFNDDLINREPKTNKDKYRFGFIGGNEQRKNLTKIIEAFYLCFKNHKDVELYIHSAYSAESEYVRQTEELIRKYSNDIDIIYHFNSALSADEMYELISSFNFYVYPSKTTGYFTTPAEALSVGIPIIVTDIPVHQELVQNLTEKDGVYLIKAEELDVIQHSYLGNKYLGVQYDCSVEAIAKQLIKAYNDRDNLFSKNQILTRKSVGKQYNLSSISSLYSSVFRPKEFYVSDIHGVTPNNTIWGTEELAQKYLNIFPNLQIGYKSKPAGFMFYIHKEKETKLVERLSKTLEHMRCKIMELEYLSTLESSSCTTLKKIFYLFGTIPILKTKKSKKKIQFFLFSFIPLLKIQRYNANKIISLLGFIPFLKIKEKNK